MTELHSYSIQAKLSKLVVTDNNIPAAKKGGLIGELLSFNIKFALNTIPKAVVSLPVGDKLKSSGLKESTITAKKIEELSDQHTPVGIYVTLYGDSGKSDKKPTRVPEGEFCLFKGFIEGCSYSRSESNVSITLQLAHWLQQLTVFPLVNSMIDPQVVGTIGRSFPINASANIDRRQLGNKVLTGSWLQKNKTSCYFLIDAITSLSNLGDEDMWSILKNILIAGMPKETDNLAKIDPGFVSKDLYAQAQKVLSVINGKNLDIASKFIATSNLIKFSIAAYIAALTEQQLAMQTPWDAMVSGILPSFYMALAPAVDKAFVIPIPGQCMDIEDCLEITCDDYKSIEYSRTSRPMIGGVMLYFTIKQGSHRDMPATAFRYPQNNINKPGPFQFINAPQWINADQLSGAAITGNSSESFYSCFKREQKPLKKKAKKEKEKQDQETKTLEDLMKRLVKSAYQVLSCQGRSCVITLPFRADIMPGSQIKIQAVDILSDKDSKYMCGTVTSVNFVVSANSADTVIELNNIRTEAEMNDPELTSKTGVFFKDAFHYAKEDNEVLYAK